MVKSQGDSNDNLLVNSLKVCQVTKQNKKVTQGRSTEQRCSVKHDSMLLSRNSSLYFTSPTKGDHERLGAAIAEGAAQRRSLGRKGKLNLE